jgi:hypothetical protein
MFHLFSETLHLPEAVIYFLVVLTQSTTTEASHMYLLHVNTTGSFIWIGKKSAATALQLVGEVGAIFCG